VKCRSRRPAISFFAALVTLGVWCAASIGAPAIAGATTAATPQYLALGGSASVGVQPTSTAPRGQPTDTGYADDLVPLIRQRWSGLQLSQLGCPGATVSTFLYGRGRCHYATGTQLSAAINFLGSHPATTRLVTIDLGFNNIRPCLMHGLVNQVCLSKGLRLLRQQLPVALALLRKAAGNQVDIVGVGHYDPFVVVPTDRSSRRSFAATTVGAVEQLNSTLRSIYGRFGVAMADVSNPFDMTRRNAVIVAGRSEPKNSARACELTWMCAGHPYGPNLHPNDAGYRVIARAIAQALPRLSTA
jgi:lysophospholipase L1-like esterase